MENGFPFSSFPAIFSFGLDQPVCKFSFWTTFLQIVVHDNIFQILQIVLPYRLFTKFANFQSTQIHCILCWLLFWTIFFFYKLLFSTTYLQIAVSHIVLWICELSRQAIFFLLQIVITFLQLGLLYHSFANFEKCHFGQHYTSCSSGQRLLELYTKKLFAMLLQLISHVIFFRCASISWFQVVSKWVNE